MRPEGEGWMDMHTQLNGSHRWLRFSLRSAAGAQDVFVAGDFIDWKPVWMPRHKDGCLQT